ncbi:MAG: hypothetical protein IH624_03090 [Phycisphaerae bacterium]|nr:hypothetical protein [Phycisphaerae bacterium]
MQVLGKEITDWIGDVLNLSSPDGEEAFLQTRLALLLANMPCRWDTVFMADAPVPEALAAALRETLQSVPRFSPGRMELNPLELGLVPHLAEAALHTLEGTPWLRVIVAWGSFASLFGFLFYLTR